MSSYQSKGLECQTSFDEEIAHNTTPTEQCQDEKIKPEEVVQYTNTMKLQDEVIVLKLDDYEEIPNCTTIPKEADVEKTDVRDFIKEMKILNLQGCALALVEHNEYTEASKYFRKLENLKPNQSAEIYNMILLTECNIMCGDYYLACSNIKNIAELLNSQHLSASEVEKFGVTCNHEKQYVRAVVVHSAAVKLCQMTANVSDLVAFMTSQVNQITDIVEAGVVERCGYIHRITLHHIIPYFQELIHDLTKITAENQNEIVLWHSECLFYVGLCYTHCESYNESIAVLESALCLMNTEMNNKCENFRLYGGCIKLLATLYAEIGKKEVAIEKFNAAIHAFQKATDWKKCDEKNKTIADTRESLWELENNTTKKKLSVAQKIGKWLNKK
uniref:uncharacterized protein LOC120328558 n=1 Tax=Styela clava TaxID=7725 RepID=UPI001939ED78|nr:uncharacterized protein LOC120328558 [Styela clava]